MSKALVIGGAGQLGRVIVGRMAARGWGVTSVDFNAVEQDGVSNVLLSADTPWAAQVEALEEQLQGVRCGLVVSAGGGWAGGSAGEPGFIASVESMWAMNVQSAATAAHLGAQLLEPSGRLVLTGAAASLGPTVGMTGYGLSKAAVHHLVRDLAAQFESDGSGRAAVGVLPSVIDTASNRAGMPDADFTSWTAPEVIADKIGAWASGDEQPGNGDLCSVTTEAGASTWSSTRA